MSKDQLGRLKRQCWHLGRDSCHCASTIEASCLRVPLLSCNSPPSYRPPVLLTQAGCLDAGQVRGSPPASSEPIWTSPLQAILGSKAPATHCRGFESFHLLLGNGEFQMTPPSTCNSPMPARRHLSREDWQTTKLFNCSIVLKCQDKLNK